MASTTTKLSPWLIKAKEDLSQTQEWKDLISELFEAIQQQLAENHIKYFADLSESEKVLFLDRAAKLVKESLRHKNLVATASAKLDQHMNESIMDKLMDPRNSKTKTELVLESACDACSILLQKWPNMRTKLFTCFNRPLNAKLRRLIWKMLLVNPKLRDDFTKGPIKPSKAQENVVKQRCQAFLSSETYFTSLSRQNIDTITNIMAKCLVYKQLFFKDSLADTDYLLILPFLKVVVEDCLHGDDTHSNDVHDMCLDVLEMFSAFLEYRPAYMKDSGSKEFNEALKQVGEVMESMLRTHDSQLAESIEKCLAQGGNLGVGLVNLIRSYLRSLFIGYLPLDVVCYIWDQHILGLKLPKLRCIPTFAVVLLMLLKNKITKCRTLRDIEIVLVEGCKTLKTKQFQDEIDTKFMTEWKKHMDEEMKGYELPLVDPIATLGQPQPWTWWFQDRPVTRQRPEDRHAAREARELDKMRIEQQMRKEELQKQKDERQRRKREEENLRNAFDQDKKIQDGKIASLERDLALEQQKRSDVEREMGDEITRLRDELSRLKGTESIPINSTGMFNSHVSVHPSRSPVAVVASSSGNLEVQELLKQILKTTTEGVHQLAHGTETQKQQLQQVATTALNVTKTDYEEAEIILFGRKLTEEDWNEMAPDKRQINRELLFKKLDQLRQEKTDD